MSPKKKNGKGKRYSYVTAKFSRKVGNPDKSPRKDFIDASFMTAAQRGQKILKELYEYNPTNRKVLNHIQKGADIEQRDTAGRTALMCAIERGNWEVFDVLLARGAEINIVNSYGRTPLIFAAIFNQTKMVEALLEAGASIDIVADNGHTALIAAVTANNKQAVDLLVTHKADTELADKTGYTALTTAITRGYEDIALLLLEKGARFSALSPEGEKLPAFARKCGMEAVAKYIETTIRDHIAAMAGKGLPSNKPLKPQNPVMKPKKPR